MGYQSEAELEKLLIEQLVRQGYSKVKKRKETPTPSVVGVSDSHQITDLGSLLNEDDLRANLREMLSIFNEEKLGYKELTDKEFERIERYLEGKSVYQSAKMLRDKFILEREDGSEVYIEFFDLKNWCQNLFQVTPQVTNEELRLKIDLIKNFLDKVLPNLKSDESIDDAYSDFEEEERKKEVKYFSDEIGVSEDVIYEHIAEYQFSGILDNEAMSDEIKAPLLKKRKILKVMKYFIKAHVRKFE